MYVWTLGKVIFVGGRLYRMYLQCHGFHGIHCHCNITASSNQNPRIPPFPKACRWQAKVEWEFYYSCTTQPPRHEACGVMTRGGKLCDEYLRHALVTHLTATQLPVLIIVLNPLPPLARLQAARGASLQGQPPWGQPFPGLLPRIQESPGQCFHPTTACCCSPRHPPIPYRDMHALTAQYLLMVCHPYRFQPCCLSIEKRARVLRCRRRCRHLLLYYVDNSLL